MKSNLLHQRLLFAAASRGRGECRARLVTAGVLPPLLCAGFKCNFKINGAHPSAKRLPWLGTMITSNQPTVLRIVSQFLHRYFRKTFPTSFNKDFCSSRVETMFGGASQLATNVMLARIINKFQTSKYESCSLGLPKSIDVILRNTNLESGTDLCGGAETPQVDASSARWRRSLAAAIYNLHAALVPPLVQSFHNPGNFQQTVQGLGT